jgi:hypothetical protein
MINHPQVWDYNYNSYEKSESYIHDPFNIIEKRIQTLVLFAMGMYHGIIKNKILWLNF